MACIAASVGLLGAPWRQRGWVIVFVYAAISLLFLGTLADLEHAFAILLVLWVDRSFRIQRTTVREQRLIAFAGILSLGIIQILALLIPTNGPFGSTQPLSGPWVDVALDTIVIVIVAGGLRRGRRWAWLVSVIWIAFAAALAALVYFLVKGNPLGLDLDTGDGVDVGDITSRSVRLF